MLRCLESVLGCRRRRSVGRLDQALALVLLDDAAVLAGEALELRVVETAAGDDQAVRVVERRSADGGHRGDDVVDVVLDVDAGLRLEFLLALFVLGSDVLEALAELRVHDLADVGVGDDRGVGRHVAQAPIGPGGRPTAMGSRRRSRQRVRCRGRQRGWLPKPPGNSGFSWSYAWPSGELYRSDG